jgi:hypothetical protein
LAESAPSFMAPEYREDSATVNRIFMIDLPRASACRRTESGCGFARCRAPTMRPTRCHLGGADGGVAPDIDEREVIASRRGRVVEGATDW